MRKQSKHLLNLLSFSMRSLGRAYGREFLLRALVRHPGRSLAGLLAYARRPAGEWIPGNGCSPTELAGQLGLAVNTLLVGTGYCQKPLRSAGSAHDCPAGRFNHDCLRLSQGNGRENGMERLACADCVVGELGTAALDAGASFCILTSAMDLAADILLPSIESGRFTQVALGICGYSVAPLTAALSVCGIDGFVFPYEERGACANYDEWLRADLGEKPHRTRIPHSYYSILHRALSCVAEEPRPTKRGYQRVGNVYVPALSESMPGVIQRSTAQAPPCLNHDRSDCPR
jgi:hypothetical protein